jgi:hypothetical protein
MLQWQLSGKMGGQKGNPIGKNGRSSSNGQGGGSRLPSGSRAASHGHSAPPLHAVSQPQQDEAFRIL